MLGHFHICLNSLFGVLLSYYQNLSLDMAESHIAIGYTLCDIFLQLGGISLYLMVLLSVLLNIINFILRKDHFSIQALSTWTLYNSKSLSVAHSLGLNANQFEVYHHFHTHTLADYQLALHFYIYYIHILLLLLSSLYYRKWLIIKGASLDAGPSLYWFNC